MYEKSWEDVKFPTNRYKLFQSPDDWLKNRQCDGGAENLWRVHDNLYDLSSFIQKHPGGAMWLTLTRVSIRGCMIDCYDLKFCK